MDHLLEIPIEIWERVMDHLCLDYQALVACSLVCRAWLPRSRFHLLSRAHLQSRADVYRLARNLKSLDRLKNQRDNLYICGGPTGTARAPMPHLGTLATVLAHRPPRAESLCIWLACWRGIPDNTFLHLTTFITVTWLTLMSVTFPNVLTFGRLVYALPSLERLSCMDVSFEKKGPPATFYSRPTRILCFNILSGTPMEDVVDFIADTGNIAQGLEELDVAWLDPVPLLKELKALRVKPVLQAASSSLLRFDIRLGGVNMDPAEALKAIDELGLSRNTNLTQLRLTLHSPPSSAQQTPIYPCTWMHTLLTTITSIQLAYLIIYFDVRDLDPGPDHRAVPDSIALLLTPEVASAIDTLLAGEQFQGLNRVYLGVRCAHQGMLVDEKAWVHIVSRRFPMLKARGILYASVDIDLEPHLSVI